ncbi:MAG: shikimate dehydrogenase family protein [Candidatus Binatia bacterium]
MASPKAIAAIGRCLSNPLDTAAIGEKSFAGVIGDAPSQYSKSPQLWNAAFRHLQINSVYVPFDVAAADLGNLLAAFKDSQSFLGANVTVPHKVRAMDFLDEIDPGAGRIQAVNTIARTADGKLVGYNTDGEGFVQSILQPTPDRTDSLLPSFNGMNVLLLGAGGSARAVAFHVADLLADGRLFICNRTPEPARSLAAEIQKVARNATAIAQGDLPTWAPKAGLIVNSTTKGQGGIRRLANGMATLMESYSALAPADPPALAEADAGKSDFERQWSGAAGADIEANNQASMQLAQSIPPHVRFYDLIYHPEETVFLRHGRLTGHPTMNGKSMIINQALIAFCKRICNAALQARGIDTPDTYKQILEVMYQAW